MNFLRSLVVCAGVASMVGVVACSSDDSSASAASCSQAKSISDSCKSQPKDGGSSITLDFDQAKCESGGDQGKKVADCIVANKSNCDCLLKCAVNGAC
ncbi:hypothetical protein BH11MYX4_BH11MYX4_53300 [soil metagenome]